MRDLPIHYVYYHKHPESGKILYVGHGRNERAWRCTTSGDSKHYGHRSAEYSELLLDLQLRGYIPTDWVRVYKRGLTKAEACALEQKITHEFKPEFNKPLGLTNLKIKGELLRKARELRESGMFYSDISKQLNISTMAVWRALNGKNKNNAD